MLGRKLVESQAPAECDGWVGTWPRLSRESSDGVSNVTSATPQGAADATGALCQGDPAAADRGFLRTVCGQLANSSWKDLA